jgi:hypothetical protein
MRTSAHTDSDDENAFFSLDTLHLKARQALTRPPSQASVSSAVNSWAPDGTKMAHCPRTQLGSQRQSGLGLEAQQGSRARLLRWSGVEG